MNFFDNMYKLTLIVCPKVVKKDCITKMYQNNVTKKKLIFSCQGYDMKLWKEEWLYEIS